MNRVKIILGYIFGFLLSVTIAILSICLILKATAFNKQYIKRSLTKNNYVDKVYNTIGENIKNDMISTGFPDSIIDGVYTKDSINIITNNTIDTMFEEKNVIIDTSDVEEKLTKHINDYFKGKKVDKKAVDAFIKDTIKIYKNELDLYGSINTYAKFFNKAQALLNIAIITLSIVTIVLFAALLILKVNYKGSVIMASSLIIAFLIYLFSNKVDYQNILVISYNSSYMLRIICRKIVNLMLIYSTFLGFLGLFITIKESFTKKALKKRRIVI